MTIRSRLAGLLAAMVCSFTMVAAPAQTNPSIRSLTVDPVAQLTPGTELVFRADGTGNGVFSLRVDGVTNLIGLPQTQNGVYEGAYTISVRDKIRFDSKVNATLKVGDRQTTVLLAQPLLTAEAQAKAVMAANPAPAISRLETRNDGALSGGHELSFVVDGTAGAKTSVSLDGGKTSIPLAEEKAGHYTGSYTVKSRDQLNDLTQVSATLVLGDRKATAVKVLAAGFVLPQAVVALACEGCGVVQSVSKVKVRGKPNYLGAIAGGVAGAALGNQVGKGDGNAAATVLGAVGGAVAGREVEKRVRSTTVYDVVVKLNDASTKTVRFEADPGFKVGSKVKLSGETLVANE